MSRPILSESALQEVIHFGEGISLWRARHDVGRIALSEASGVSVSTLTRMEEGNALKFTAAHKALCDYLECCAKGLVEWGASGERDWTGWTGKAGL